MVTSHSEILKPFFSTAAGLVFHQIFIAENNDK